MAKKVDAAGRAAIMQREGVRLVAYRDSVGKPTVGCGHYDATPPIATLGMTISMAQCDALLSADLAPMEKVVNETDPSGGLSQNAFNASVSLAFNIGAAGFAKSTVARKIANGDMPGAADAFLMWAHPTELMGRRRAERAQFLTPDACPALPLIPGATVFNGIATAINLASSSASYTPKDPAPMATHSAAPTSDVPDLQRKLTTLGFYAGPVDGDFGPATDEAVRAFQLKAGLTVDGEVGPKTLAAIIGALSALTLATATLPKPAPAVLVRPTAPPHLLPPAAKPSLWQSIKAAFAPKSRA